MFTKEMFDPRNWKWFMWMSVACPIVQIPGMLNGSLASLGAFLFTGGLFLYCVKTNHRIVEIEKRIEELNARWKPFQR